LVKSGEKVGEGGAEWESLGDWLFWGELESGSLMPGPWAFHWSGQLIAISFLTSGARRVGGKIRF